MRLAVIEHLPFRATLLIAEEFILPFGLALQATAAQAGVLSGLPRLASAFGQLATARLLRLAGGTRPVFVGAALAGAVAFAVIAAIPALPAGVRVPALMAMAVVAHLLVELANPAWGVWVGGAVPLRHRGRFLALRVGVGSIATIVVFLAAGWYLDSAGERIVAAFVALFACAAAMRVMSALLLRGLAEPPRAVAIRLAPSAASLRALPRSDLGRFLLLSGVLHWGVFIAAPYISVYELRDLGFSYLAYASLIVLFTVAQLASMRTWGPLADRRGNVIGIRVSIFFIVAIPVLWAPVQAPSHAVLAQLASGVGWGGMTLCGLNFVYETSSPEERATNVALYNALNGAGMFLGALSGGLLLGFVPLLAGSPLPALFLVSGAIRLAIAFAIIAAVREVRGHASVKPLPTAPAAR